MSPSASLASRPSRGLRHPRRHTTSAPSLEPGPEPALGAWQDKRSLKLELKELELAHEDAIRDLKQENDKNITKLRQQYEREVKELQQKYEKKMKLLREDLELRRKACPRRRAACPAPAPPTRRARAAPA